MNLLCNMGGLLLIYLGGITGEITTDKNIIVKTHK